MVVLLAFVSKANLIFASCSHMFIIVCCGPFSLTKQACPWTQQLPAV